MANTAKLNLPLIDDNMVADVPRDVNAIANGIDSKAGAANGLATLGSDGKVPAAQLSVSTPPDASTTRKGIVQLNDSVTSTSTTQAATANAVKTAHDRANDAYNLADAAATQAEAQAIANAAETNAKNASLPRTGGELTGTLTVPQIYLPNGTRLRSDETRTFINTSANRFDVLAADGTKYLISARGGDFYMYDENGNIITSAKDLKSSVANGKQAIATAISGKGIAASGSDEFAVLAGKISQINTGKRFATGRFTIGTNGQGAVNNLAFRPRSVIFGNRTNTNVTRYAGVYSADAPIEDGTPLSHVFGLDNGLRVSNAVSILSSGFSVSAPGITETREYNYIAFE